MTCNGCGGVIGVDCFNPPECQVIAADMQAHIVSEVQRDVYREELERCRELIGGEVASVSDEVEGLVEDGKRMDWIERNRLITPIVFRYIDGYFGFRQAIDTARSLKWVTNEAMEAAARSAKEQATA